MKKSYMLEELQESEQLFKKIGLLDDKIFNKLQKLLSKRRVILVGMGSSFFLAEIGKYFLQHTGKKSNIYVTSANELENNFPLLNDDYIIITLSQSGNTKKVSNILLKYKNTFSIVNTECCEHVKLGKDYYNIGIGKEKSPVSTKYVIYMIIFFYKFSCFLQGVKSINLEKYINYTNILFKNYKKLLNKMVHVYQKGDNFLLIGDGINNFVAKEISLKIRETTGISASYDDCGQLKHGGINSVTDNTICILLQKDKYIEDMIVKKGGKIILLSEVLKNFDSSLLIVQQIIALDLLIYLLAERLQIDTNIKMW